MAEIEGEGAVTLDEAAERVDYRLGFHRLDRPREFGPEFIDGPWIDDARLEGGKAPGEWYGGNPPLPPEKMTAQDYFTHWVGMAVAESVHEALEWFKVDGKPWLDPHGRAKHAIDRLLDELSVELAALVDGEVLDAR